MALQRIPEKNIKYIFEKHDVSNIIRESCTYNVLKFLPRDFKLTTNNCSYYFNTNILSNSSIIILHHIEENPNYLTYHLDIKNCDDVIKKLEQVYQGENIHLNEKEVQIYEVIVKKLDFQNNFLQRKSKILLQIDQCKDANININQQSLYSFLQSNIPETFVIQTKKAEYKCNEYGILLSSVIRENLSKDPKIDRFFYDYEDDENEFELINNILNFKTTDINKDNVNTILKMCKELRIDCLIPILTNYIKDNQKIDQLIENQQSIVDSINNLFDLLYHIKEKTVDLVADKIIQSKWSKTEDNIYELAAFIIQVIRSKQELHEYLIDLLLKLNENTTSKLNILLPYIINYSIYDLSLFIFIRLLYKRNIISFEKVINLLSNCKFDNIGYVSSLFSKELDEFCTKRNMEINSLLPKINYESYLSICKKNKNVDLIAIAIENDDIDTFQKLISPNIDKYLNKKVEQILITPNIWWVKRKDHDIFLEVTHLNYAAAKGSINCFKFLLLNNQNIDKDTLSMAIIGGNTEIIRIAFNKNNDNDFPIDDAIIISIEIHRYDIFDWLFEMVEKQKCMNDLFYSIAKNGNIHALIQIMDRIDLIHTNNNVIEKLNEDAAESGFYLLTIFLFSFIDKKKIYHCIDNKFCLGLSRIAMTGNLSIFKLFEKLLSEIEFVHCIQISIEIGLMNIIEYISELFRKRNIKFSSKSTVEILTSYLNNSSNENLVHFIETINKILSININVLYEVIKNNCKSKNIKEYMKIADLIHDENESNDFTNILYLFIKYNLKEMFNYFIDNKYHIDFEDLSEQIILNQAYFLYYLIK